MDWKHWLMILVGAALPAADHVVEAAPVLTLPVLAQSAVAGVVAAFAVFLKSPSKP